MNEKLLAVSRFDDAGAYFFDSLPDFLEAVVVFESLIDVGGFFEVVEGEMKKAALLQCFCRQREQRAEVVELFGIVNIVLNGLQFEEEVAPVSGIPANIEERV